MPSRSRGSLDRCGDVNADVFASRSTWPSPRELKTRGKIDLNAPENSELRRRWDARVAGIKDESADFCCGTDRECRDSLARNEISLCRSVAGEDEPDRCAFGGSYDVPGRAYRSLFGHLLGIHAGEAALRALVVAGPFRPAVAARTGADGTEGAMYPMPGKITLTNYVDRKKGIAALEPTLRHELGHACVMTRMQLSAARGGSEDGRARAERALRWLNSVKRRCLPTAALPDAYDDFWEDLGEDRGLSRCLTKIAELNRDGKVDGKCAGLCPGHYLEEATGIAFSLLTGPVRGPGSVFPATCSHIRDVQHPMVADVVECLGRHSPRFRAKTAAAYGCR